MRLFEADFETIVASLPDAIALPRETGHPRDENVCLVAILGFEARCYAAAEALDPRRWSPRKAVCIEYRQDEMRDANNRHRPRFVAAITRLVSAENQIWLSHDDHSVDTDFGDQLCSALSTNGFDLSSPRTRIILDISVGSSRLLLEGLHALLQSGASLTILYAEASEYRPSFEEYRTFVERHSASEISTPEFLAHGIDKVAPLRRLPGQNADARPTYLTVVPSFTPLRIGAVLEELSPNRVYWLFGLPHLVRNRWRLDAQLQYHAHLVQGHHRHCYVSTFDYREMLIVLEATYRRQRSDYSLLICSLGSKMQKLGQALFHILRPEVGAVVSIPKVWDPESYSGDKPRSIYSISLGDCDKLRTALWRTRTFRV